MFSTTVLIDVHIRYVKMLPIVVAIGYLVGFFDGLFWTASMKKIPHGAWVPLTIGGMHVGCAPHPTFFGLTASFAY